MVAIEFGMWRSVRSGGAVGSVTVGNGKFFEQPGGTSSTGGNRLLLGDQESVSGGKNQLEEASENPRRTGVSHQAGDGRHQRMADGPGYLGRAA